MPTALDPDEILSRLFGSVSRYFLSQSSQRSRSVDFPFYPVGRNTRPNKNPGFKRATGPIDLTFLSLRDRGFWIWRPSLPNQKRFPRRSSVGSVSDESFPDGHGATRNRGITFRGPESFHFSFPRQGDDNHDIIGLTVEGRFENGL